MCYDMSGRTVTALDLFVSCRLPRIYNHHLKNYSDSTWSTRSILPVSLFTYERRQLLNVMMTHSFVLYVCFVKTITRRETNYMYIDRRIAVGSKLSKRATIFSFGPFNIGSNKYFWIRVSIQICILTLRITGRMTMMVILCYMLNIFDKFVFYIECALCHK